MQPITQQTKSTTQNTFYLWNNTCFSTQKMVLTRPQLTFYTSKCTMNVYKISYVLRNCESQLHFYFSDMFHPERPSSERWETSGKYPMFANINIIQAKNTLSYTVEKMWTYWIHR